jgi:hypothetical protein
MNHWGTSLAQLYGVEEDENIGWELQSSTRQATVIFMITGRIIIQSYKTQYV